MLTAESCTFLSNVLGVLEYTLVAGVRGGTLYSDMLWLEEMCINAIEEEKESSRRSGWAIRVEHTLGK